MTFSDQKLLDEKLSEFFQGELPKPFPIAPKVFAHAFRPRKSHSVGSRLALAACLLILAGLAIFWPRATDGTPPDNSHRSNPASASDDKRHQVPFMGSKNTPKPALTVPR